MRTLLAASTGGTPGGLDPEQVTPGLLGFLVVAAIGLATWALLRSLNRQLGRIRLPEPAQPAEPTDPGQPADATEPTDPPYESPTGRVS